MTRHAPADGAERMLARRLVQLYLGLLLYGVGIALLVRARLGLDSWDVLHQGIARQTGATMGVVVIGVGALVMLLWLPLHQRPGLGTVSNVILVGLVLDVALDVLPSPGPLLLRALCLAGGILAIAVATGLYIGAGLGPGPRDGLMTGLAQRGYSIRLSRTVIELGVLAVGWLLGGSVGVGTVIYAVTIGPAAHVVMPRLAITPRQAI